jgi:hypothetical protein
MIIEAKKNKKLSFKNKKKVKKRGPFEVEKVKTGKK